MKVLVVGNGAREDTLAWKIVQSPLVDLGGLYCAPGNAGTRRWAVNIPIAVDDIYGLRDFALAHKIDLTVVGPELTLSLGIVDVFTDAGLLIVGPSQAAAQLETSKAFAKRFMWEEDIPTAHGEIFDDYDLAAAFIEGHQGPLVVKADGLAAGKGVTVCENADAAMRALHACMKEGRFGPAGERVVLEECLEGEEVSCHYLVDGTRIVPLTTAQDYKRVYGGKDARMTGGMGTHSPAPIITPELNLRILNQIVYPTVRAMAARGMPYRGVLYVGLMIVDGKPFVLEFNVRFGDPETQPLLVRLKNDVVPLLHGVAMGNLEGQTADYDDDTAICVVIATKGYPGALEETGLRIVGLSRAARYANTHLFHASTELDARGRIITGKGGRVVSVVFRHPGPKFGPAIAGCYRAVRHINWRKPGKRKITKGSVLEREEVVRESGAYCRWDIGSSLLPWSTGSNEKLKTW